MKYYSTNNKALRVELKDAVLNSLPADNGLYMPEEIPLVSQSFLKQLNTKSLQEIAYEVLHRYLIEDLSEEDIVSIIQLAFNFESPVVPLNNSLGILELFHGPSLAFKDFGARFMARLMSKLNEGESKQLNILVATSGDTGGAVASGFYGVPGIEVIILYPSGRVSGLQEQQLTTLGKNITALEVKGAFDDCQKLVKQAFLDPELNRALRLSSANSINIARLLPQAVYYFDAYKQVKHLSDKIVFSIPSGNFGNLTAALMGKKMGLPYHNVIAATNINKVVPDYLRTGSFEPRESIATISNAMDVGNPSNFVRMLDLCNGSYETIQHEIKGYFFSDDETRKGILEINDNFDYIIDPHGSVGYLAAKEYLKTNPYSFCVLVETANPCKFDKVFKELSLKFKTPERVQHLKEKKKESILMENDYQSFKDFLLARK